MPFLKLMPTGGVQVDNLASYLAAGAVAVGVGGSLVDAQRISKGEWSAITLEARRFTDAAGSR